MPTNTLRITTRKTPCGEGSKTWDRFQVSLKLERLQALEFATESASRWLFNGCQCLKITELVS